MVMVLEEPNEKVFLSSKLIPNFVGVSPLSLVPLLLRSTHIPARSASAASIQSSHALLSSAALVTCILGRPGSTRRVPLSFLQEAIRSKPKAVIVSVFRQCFILFIQYRKQYEK